MIEQENVHEAYHLPPFNEIMSDDFRSRFDLLPAQQYGIACRDVQAECTRAESMGAGPFLSFRTAAPHWTENGRRVAAKLDVSLGYTQDSQMEFLGPGKGTTFYSDTVKESSTALHHIGIYQNGIEKIEHSLNDAGYKTVVSGGIGLGRLFGIKFKYFDTRCDLGCYLEILDFYVLGKIPIPIRAPVETLARLRSRGG